MELSSKLEDARKKLREKNRLDITDSALADNASVSVMHQVQKLEDSPKRASAASLLRDSHALSHSLSWKQKPGDKGQPVWECEEKNGV